MRSGIDNAAVDPDVRPQDDLFGHVNGRWVATTPDPRGPRPLRHLRHPPRDRGAPCPSDHRGGRGRVPRPRHRRRARSATSTPASWTRTPSRPSAAPRSRRTWPGGRGGGAGRRRGRRRRASPARASSGSCCPSSTPTTATPRRYVVYLEQAGLGLPDESYYREEQHAATRAAYVGHVERMLALAGWPEPAEAAERVMAPRDPARRGALGQGHQPRPPEDLQPRRPRRARRAEPGVDWDGFLHGLGAARDAFDESSCASPTTPLDGRRPGRRAGRRPGATGSPGTSSTRPRPTCRRRSSRRTSTSTAGPCRASPSCGSAGSAASASSRRRSARPSASSTWSGTSRPPPRSGWTSSSPTSSRRSGAACRSLPWMGDDTRREALEKLDRFTPKIGYPDKWRDYSTLEVRADDLLGNVRRAVAFEVDRQLAKLGGPVDRDEWLMTPQTVNAYYNPGLNEIVFPAAILQPPVLRRRGRRRRQLRRHRRGHRPRDRARLRRPGLAVRRHGHPAQLVDRRRPRGLRGARRRPHRAVQHARDP